MAAMDSEMRIIARSAHCRKMTRASSLVLAKAVAAVCLSVFAHGCATTPGGFNRDGKSADLAVSNMLTSLETGRYSGLAASLDGRIFLAESSGWRLRAYGPAGERLFEVTLPSARCLLGGGQVQGFCIADQISATFIRFDQNGERAFSAPVSGHAIDAFYLAASGEAAILDAGQDMVAFRDQGFRETRRWKLRGRGRPQALAADMLDGLVAVGYPGQARLDVYSVFGVMLESLPLDLMAGPQTMAFDGQGRLWAATAGGRAVALKLQGRRLVESGSSLIPGLCALCPGPGGSVLALGDSGLFKTWTD